MPYVSQFSKKRGTTTPPVPQSAEYKVLDMRGLDLVNPYDVIDKNRSPFARNFRMYAQEAEDRRVAISSRKGSGKYLNPLNEAQAVSNESVVGSDNAILGIDTEWKAVPFTAPANHLLTKVELRLSRNGAAGPIVVAIHADNAGVPGVKLADSGILGSTVSDAYAYTAAAFIEAPELTLGAKYWIVAYQQDDTTGNYIWRYNTETATALTSNTAGLSWTATTYTLNFKVYTTPKATVKGLARFTPADSNNRTVMAINDTVYSASDTTGNLTSILAAQNAAAQDYHFSSADGKLFWVNGLNNLRAWNGTTVETITHAQLPLLSLFTFHKNVPFGVTAADPNKVVFGLSPVEQDPLGNSWYRGWLSTSFFYIPAPKAAEPITAIVSFQDTLVVFTRTDKWVVYGSTEADIQPRPAMGKKGAVHQNAVYADENFVYFVSDDGFYRWDGSKDTLISELVQPEIDRIGNIEKAVVTKWQRQIRFYYNVKGSPVNNRCLIWHTVLEEMMLDTDAFVSRAVPWNDANDPRNLVEASSTAPVAHYAEKGSNNLGKAIDFMYYCKPDSMKNPAQKKRVVDFFPLLEGEGGDYPVEVGLDKDRQDQTVYTSLPLTTEGAKIGQFNIGDGTRIGGVTSFEPKRVNTSGYAYYWQPRLKRKAINNLVRFVGYVLSFRAKRL